MLLFNAPNGGYVSALPLFQNIICYCLTLIRSQVLHTGLFISKHHMLLFNCSVMCILSLSDSFQNIICYCLTSNIPIPCVTISSFQNIICYCLTDAVNAETIRVRRFQNIICYCLTRPISRQRAWEVNFKTSYVIV